MLLACCRARGRPDGAGPERTWHSCRTHRAAQAAGGQHVSSVIGSAPDGVPLAVLAEQVTALLRTRQRIQPGEQDGFMVRMTEEMANVLTSATRTITWLLASIAAVSLMVGGIRIMNKSCWSR